MEANIEIIHKSKEMIISMFELFLEKWLKVLQQFKMLLLSVREQPVIPYYLMPSIAWYSL